MTYTNTTFTGGGYSTTTPSPEAISDSASFNGYGFTGLNACGMTSDTRRGIGVQVSGYSVPRDNGYTFESSYFRRGKFAMEFTIIAKTAEELEEKIDYMFEKVHGQLSIFQLKKANGEIRQVKALAQVSSVNEEHFNITWERFVVTFDTFGDFWYSDKNQGTSQSISESITDNLFNAGNVNSEPQIYFSFTSGSATSVELSINGVSCIYTGAISTGDLLVFDCLEKQLILNGNVVEYTGTIQLDLNVGSNIVLYTVAGTFTADVVSVYRKNYKNG